MLLVMLLQLRLDWLAIDLQEFRQLHDSVLSPHFELSIHLATTVDFSPEKIGEKKKKTKNYENVW